MKKYKNMLFIVILLIFITYLLGLFIDYYGTWLWFKNMGYNSVFDTIVTTQIVSFFVFFIIFVLFSSFHIRLAYHRGSSSRNNYSIPKDDPRQLILSLYQSKKIVWLWAVIIFFFAVTMGSFASGYWNEFLKFFHSSSFNLKEPIFGIDAGFYIFKLPVYQFIVSWYIFMVVITSIAVLFSYFIDNAFNVTDGNFNITKKVKTHLTQLAAFFALGFSALYLIKLFNILYSSNGVAYGPSYMDIHAQIPAYWAIFGVSLIITILLFLYPLYKKRKIIFSALGLWVLVWVGFVWIYPTVIEQYIVKPNELKKETPYILNNIKFTQIAFGLDKIKVKDFPVTQDLTYKDILDNHNTIKNIRLWDRRPLIQTYKQLQEIRLYYNFNNVQVDRYHFDKYTEVAVGARELPESQIPERAQTWVNNHLIYTHGYGIVMNPVNEVTPNGLPKLIVKNIPPESSVNLQVKQPAIYYGQETDQFVLVNTEAKEFDYPKGNDNKYTSYAGKGGVQISSLFKRLVFAWKFSDINILFTGYLSNQSRIMFNRNIKQRVQKLAPYLSLDSQPYMVVGTDGNLYWIQDAYTTSTMFPYSEPVSQNSFIEGFNYIKNSVKIVINAYNGNVSFYVIDTKDPLIQTFQKIYPKLYKPFSDMPSFLKSHIRYPTDLFNAQVKMYNVYHMTDPKVFYNQEDYWETPNEIYSNEIQKMFPYYIIMRLPKTKNEEFILMLPLTPSKKDNMNAWLCARSDAPNYGELIVYTLPKEKLIYGPMQIEARINQKPDISSELTLWGQKGSQVIKGNQLVIPIKNSFIYVEPIYLFSESGQIPELKRVIVAYKDKIEMKKTLDEALKAIFNIQTIQTILPNQPLSTQINGSSVLSIDAQKALEHYNKAFSFLEKGNLEGFGKELKQTKSILSKMATSKKDN